ncbi:uncharacterized protein LOC133818463 [Humulus lupulus]|uniref:uncharacterized protein LOC133818463 n=1 Tax=Humulus lupulus TaxID=3486 RepID=UPI002B411CE7|nr:uncharacterized protein LOC133818463 [Humulus lupulus]
MSGDFFGYPRWVKILILLYQYVRGPRIILQNNELEIEAREPESCYLCHALFVRQLEKISLLYIRYTLLFIYLLLCVWGWNTQIIDAHRQRIVNWINATGGTSSAFDVTTKGILHSALHNQYWRLIDPQGKPTRVMGWWPSRVVTFLENHDTGSTQGHWPFPRDKLAQGYAYILTHPGTVSSLPLNCLSVAFIPLKLP